jgi:putative Mg2+ transporter-C (MgtC) family protein
MFLGFDLPDDARQLMIASAIGFALGVEREIRGKPASLRTFSLITVGSCLFTMLSVKTSGLTHSGPYDMTRIAAQVVSGVGFIGAGVIFKNRKNIEGITTAAFIWLSAALGMACGFHMNDLVLYTVVITIITHLLSFVAYGIIKKYRKGVTSS